MEKETVVPTGQEMGGPQILSRHTGKEKSLLFPCWEWNSSCSGCTDWKVMTLCWHRISGC